MVYCNTDRMSCNVLLLFVFCVWRDEEKVSGPAWHGDFLINQAGGTVGDKRSYSLSQVLTRGHAGGEQTSTRSYLFLQVLQCLVIKKKKNETLQSLQIYTEYCLLKTQRGNMCCRLQVRLVMVHRRLTFTFNAAVMALQYSSKNLLPG